MLSYRYSPPSVPVQGDRPTREIRERTLRGVTARRCRYGIALVLCMLVLTFGLTIAAKRAVADEPPALLRTFCPTGPEGGQCDIPRGIGADATSGETFVANQDNRRIEKFTPWGEFLRAWGWDVVQSGPDDDTTPPEDQFEVCVPGDGDVCQAGLAGGGAGEFGNLGPQGVAVDSEGDVYVIDWSGRRVQKFGPEGEFLLTFGGGVNKTKVESGTASEAEENLCPIDPGDVCQEGTQGSGPGQFGFWRLGSYAGVDTDGTETAADDVIYVGDQERVQEFDNQGHYTADLPDPDEVLKKEGTVNSLAVDPASGDIYLGFFQNKATEESLPGVQKLNPAGEKICTIEAHNPSAISVAPNGDVYVVEGRVAITGGAPREVARYDSTCGGREALFGPEGPSTEDENLFTANPTGIAASGACREAGEEGVDLSISNPDPANSFIRLFGPPPNAGLCPPPPKPPFIAQQFASSVGTDGAIVRAKINPRFWPDTAYYVQYGTAACLGEAEDWEAACVKEQPVPPGLVLSETTSSEELSTKGVFLGATEPLIPDTTYRYRFVAKSGFALETPNGPVYGAGGGEETAPGVYVTEGRSGTFHTLPLPGTGKGGCPNQPFRTGPSAQLPDCRAYEMVSPLEKNSGDVAAARPTALDQAAADGEALTFASISNTFGEPQSAPFVNQYMAERGSEGWNSRSINAPRKSVGLVFGENLNTRFKAFSEDLCSGWELQDTDVPLVGGEVPRGVVNLYRAQGLRAGCGGGGGYELLTTIFPPGYEPAVEKTEGQYDSQVQGFSTDGQSSVFRAAAALSEDACRKTIEEEGEVVSEEGRGLFQVYLSREGTPGVAPVLVSVLPDREPACTQSSVGTSQGQTGAFAPREDSLRGAISTDAGRIYWTVSPNANPPKGNNSQAGANPGKIYLRLNPTRARSELAHGSASGTGDLIGPAEGTGRTGNNSEVITQVKETAGKFAVGQEITDSEGKIPAGTKIVALNLAEEKLTISAKATGTKVGDILIGHASEVIPDLSTEEGSFEAGQTIRAPGIPFGTTVLSCAPSCGPGASSLTLSAQATRSGKAVALEAFSACTEAEEKACTIPVSEEAEALSGTEASRFLSAAADGSTAILQTGSDLYEFDLAKALAGEAPDTLIAHGTLGIMGTGEDAATVYLLSEEEAGGEGEAGEPNLYRYERGVGLSFIATLGGADDAAVTSNATRSSSIEIAPLKHLARVSPDGASLAFVSSDPALAQSVAGYDNLDAASGRADREVYLYRAGEGALACVSCNPSGARPTGRATEQPNQNPASWIWSASRLPGWSTSMHPGNALSADGRRVFFESFEALVSRDTNGRTDVYEWELVGGPEEAARKECLEQIGGELYVPASNGCLSLISSGQAGSDSEFLDASEDGRDAFIITDARLLPQDTDGFRDVYDARALGGFPPPPPVRPECEGDACQSTPAPPPAPTPSSQASGPSGNLAPAKPRCAKGKRRVVRKGKAHCVPAHHRHHRRRSHR